MRVCVARALYAGARLLALDEPLGALDAALARHVVARALVPATRAGRTVLIATNRLELLHYADLVNKYIPSSFVTTLLPYSLCHFNLTITFDVRRSL